MKKPLVLLVALSFLIFGGACFTPLLYDKPVEASRSFTEDVSTFLITENGKQLIVIGKEHHYIFNANDTLKFILQWSEKKRVSASFSNFYIKSDQSLSGSYTLTIKSSQSLTAAENKLLISKGFKKTARKTLVYRGDLQGTRYLADKFKVPATMQLNQKYTIKMVEYEFSAAKVVKRILLTPLALTADGLLILGGGPVLLLNLIFD